MLMVRKFKEIKIDLLEVILWKVVDKLCKNIDVVEYKYVVLGFIFFKYIFDFFEFYYELLKVGEGEFVGVDLEDKDEYIVYNIFFVFEFVCWNYLIFKVKLFEIGKLVDDVMEFIEVGNLQLKGVLLKVYVCQNFDVIVLGELIDLIGNIVLGDVKVCFVDVLGYVFEYFFGEFVLVEGKQGGQFYMLKFIVSLLVNMLEFYKG